MTPPCDPWADIIDSRDKAPAGARLRIPHRGVARRRVRKRAAVRLTVTVAALALAVAALCWEVATDEFHGGRSVHTIEGWLR